MKLQQLVNEYPNGVTFDCASNRPVTSGWIIQLNNTAVPLDTCSKSGIVTTWKEQGKLFYVDVAVFQSEEHAIKAAITYGALAIYNIECNKLKFITQPN